ncbi:metalloregulator ArsR/SmtB family transcription factor [Actinophytocola sp.]|uniref:ArsR/SmtB family transcription factor n=1 Tax=Actinophytocola sp. TaxID=1872138 RepID=UPI002D7F888A|nr:metalloregulator ArsR/SmtB family transcription factor [Actinophytocola sp.]HET9144281.1 metalloregulator ArsR/SmtB family transcription factor [Actinophytocola sp.]HEU5107247.1 metalloregulator ArsR/SmtB family transcription factor [Micromonosporaceae bacterium]
MKLLHDPDDQVWRALANVVRRAIVGVLRDGPRGTGDLATVLGVDRHVLMQHLAVLRDAGLVRVESRGRHRINHLEPAPLQRIQQQLAMPIVTRSGNVPDPR